MLFAHAGHALLEGSHFKLFIQWLGHSHYVFLHFPIVLITMTALAEFIFLLSRHSLFSDAARFMIFANAFLVLPTIFFGLCLSYGAEYTGLMNTFYWWHFSLGIIIGLLSVVAMVLNERYYLKKWQGRKIYFVCLILLFFAVHATSFLGGSLTFGFTSFLPPI